MSAVSAVAPSSVQAGTVEANTFSFWYGENQALHEINLTIRPRSVTALIGPSGCGKSTFLRSLNRLNDVIPDTKHTGEIRLDGEDVMPPGTTSSTSASASGWSSSDGIHSRDPSSRTSHMARASTGAPRGQSSTRLSRARCVAPRYGTK